MPTTYSGDSMIISHKHRFIFFSNPKTGSESVRLMLEKFNEESIVPYRACTCATPFYPHMSPQEAKAVFMRRGWNFDSYRRVTCVRNPYARLVSLYQMIHRVDRLCRVLRRLRVPRRSFSRWLTQTRPDGRGGGGFRHQRWRKFGTWSIRSWAYDANDAALVTDILPLETLALDLPGLLEELKLPKVGTLPHANIGATADYQSCYTPRTRNLVAKRYGWDIRHFSYCFDSKGSQTRPG